MNMHKDSVRQKCMYKMKQNTVIMKRSNKIKQK